MQSRTRRPASIHAVGSHPTNEREIPLGCALSSGVTRSEKLKLPGEGVTRPWTGPAIPARLLSPLACTGAGCIAIQALIPTVTGDWIGEGYP